MASGISSLRFTQALVVSPFFQELDYIFSGARLVLQKMDAHGRREDEK